jgi:diadenosine tetraphosphatase ApaH/serine/threonine PP2A family protein phosphatase
MRVAVLSDIHSNLAALEAVLVDAEAAGADDFWCLGDTVGYGPQPRECLAIVRERCSLTLAGNHDLGSTGAVSIADFNPYAAAANRWTGKMLTEGDRDFLDSLPSLLTWKKVTLAHGSPREPVWEYVVSGPVAEASFASFPTPLCFVGHSHLPFHSRETQNGEPPRLDRFIEEAEVDLSEGRFIVNPGSVGQPRDGDSRASYALFDMERRCVVLHRVAYDIEETQQRIRYAGLPEYLATRLAVGH